MSQGDSYAAPHRSTRHEQLARHERRRRAIPHAATTYSSAVDGLNRLARRAAGSSSTTRSSVVAHESAETTGHLIADALTRPAASD
jgi:hypothetical protein